MSILGFLSVLFFSLSCLSASPSGVFAPYLGEWTGKTRLVEFEDGKQTKEVDYETTFDLSTPFSAEVKETSSLFDLKNQVTRELKVRFYQKGELMYFDKIIKDNLVHYNFEKGELTLSYKWFNAPNRRFKKVRSYYLDQDKGVFKLLERVYLNTQLIQIYLHSLKRR